MFRCREHQVRRALRRRSWVREDPQLGVILPAGGDIATSADLLVVVLRHITSI